MRTKWRRFFFWLHETLDDARNRYVGTATRLMQIYMENRFVQFDYWRQRQRQQALMVPTADHSMYGKVQKEKRQYRYDETRRFVRAQSRCDVSCCRWCWAHASSCIAHTNAMIASWTISQTIRTFFSPFFSFLSSKIWNVMKKKRRNGKKQKGNKMQKKK